MQVRPGDGHVGASMSDIEESVVLHKVRFNQSNPRSRDTHVVFAMVLVGRKVHMIDPDLGSCLPEDQHQKVNTGSGRAHT